MIVDSGSSDGTVAFLQSLEKSDLASRIGLVVFLSPNNIGFSLGTAQAVKMSEGTWLLSCNPDIVFTHDFVEMLKLAESNEFSVLVPRLVTSSGALQHPLRRITFTRLVFGFTIIGQVLDRRIARGGISRDFQYGFRSFDRPALVDHPPASFIMFRKSLLSQLDGILYSLEFPLYFGDTDLFTRLGERKVQIVFLPWIKMKHGSSYSKSLVPAYIYQFRTAQSMVKYAKKWKLHSSLLRIVILVDAMFGPFLSLPHIVRVPGKRDIQNSAFRLKGMILG